MCVRSAWLTSVLLLSVSHSIFAEEPKPEPTPEEKKLDEIAFNLNQEGVQLYRAGKFADALERFKGNLAIRQKLFPVDKYKDGVPDLATSLNNVGFILRTLGEHADALEYYRQSLNMRQKLYPVGKYKDGHPELMQSLTDLAFVLQSLGEHADALEYYQQSLSMRQKLYPIEKFKDGHPELANGLNNLGFILRAMGEHAKALEYYQQSLNMRQKLYPVERFKDGHPELVQSLNNLGFVLQSLGEHAKALEYSQQSLAMAQKLYPIEKYRDGHPDLAQCLNNEGFVLASMGEYANALSNLRQSLAMRQKLYPFEKYKNGHPDLAQSLNNLGVAMRAIGEDAKGLDYHQQCFAMQRQLYPVEKHKDGHPDLAQGLREIGDSHYAMGEYSKALEYFQQSHAMRQKLYPIEKFKDGHPQLALSLNNLGAVHTAMAEYGKALEYFQQSHAMRRRLYPDDKFKDGHSDLAISLTNVGMALQSLGEYAKAFDCFEQSHAMLQKLHSIAKCKDGHPDLANSLNNMGTALKAKGDYSKALEFFRQSHAMYRKLYPIEKHQRGHLDLANGLSNMGFVHQALGDCPKALECCIQSLLMRQRLYPIEKFKLGHPALAVNLANLGLLLSAMGEDSKALDNFRQSLAMFDSLASREIVGGSETQARQLLKSRPPTLDAYLSTVSRLPDQDARSYGPVWRSKGRVLQFLQNRHQSAQVALRGSETARKQWRELADVRNAISKILTETIIDAKTRDQRLLELNERQEKLERELAKSIPEIDRARKLADLEVKDFAAHLPSRSAFIDFYRYGYSENGKFQEYRYLAFVLAPGGPVHFVDLKAAQPIDDAVASWRGGIERLESGQAPAKLKGLVWDKLAAAIPVETKSIYLCPDGDLFRLPFAALPGRKASSILLEEFALAVVPSPRFLLEQLAFPQEDAGGQTLLAVGDIDYGAGGQEAVAYARLPETGKELKRVIDTFGVGGGLGLSGKEAPARAIAESLPKVQYAHFATHGFFDAAALSAERKREQEQQEQLRKNNLVQSEQQSVAAKNPLGFVGLALTGANDPAGNGIFTGLNIVDLPLENLRLCVLSACETGLGDFTAGEGVAGLQRAFHVAGCPNVIGSLWKVNDAATVALMTQFYHELRVNKKTPMEALQLAQLTIYRHPERIPELVGDRGRPALEASAKLGAAPAKEPKERGKTAATKLWAAFVLSGVGR